MNKRLLILLLVLATAAVSAWGQGVAGMAGVAGGVRDASGAAVPGAAVVVANEAMGIRRAMESNESGVFNAPSLPPAGGYSITVTHQGFATWEMKSFQLQVGQTQGFSVTLNVASTTTTVEVDATAPLISDSNVGVSQIVGQ